MTMPLKKRKGYAPTLDSAQAMTMPPPVSETPRCQHGIIGTFCGKCYPAVKNKFIYLLNSFERASQSKQPAKEGYADKRKALLTYVEQAQARINVLESEDQGTPLGRIKWLADYAEKHCGYSPVGATGPEQCIIEALEQAQARCAEQVELLRECRKWQAEGEYGDPLGPECWTPAYAAFIARLNAALSREPRQQPDDRPR